MCMMSSNSKFDCVRERIIMAFCDSVKLTGFVCNHTCMNLPNTSITGSNPNTMDIQSLDDGLLVCNVTSHFFIMSLAIHIVELVMLLVLCSTCNTRWSWLVQSMHTHTSTVAHCIPDQSPDMPESISFRPKTKVPSIISNL